MDHSKTDTGFINLHLDTRDLTPEQVRLVRSLHVMLQHVLVTDQEDEFFEGSSELMRMVASIIKQGNFAKSLKGICGIPYSDQAIEYSIDNLQEHLSSSKVVHFDN